jgi:hypothetical protein
VVGTPNSRDRVAFEGVVVRHVLVLALAAALPASVTAAPIDLRAYGFEAQQVQSYRRTDGTSLTPNMDQLMSRYQAPLAADDATARVAVPQPVYEPFRNSPNGASYKGSQQGGTGDDKQGGNNQGGNNQGGNNEGGNGRHEEPPPSPTPEPGTILLFGIAAGTAGLRARRKRNAA